jgi:hypothetical protein
MSARPPYGLELSVVNAGQNDTRCGADRQDPVGGTVTGRGWVEEGAVAGAGLVLRAVEVGGPLRWRWLLSDAESGAALADHRVDLDPGSAEVTRFGDLYGYARAYAAPDRRVADEARIVAEAGAWAGRVPPSTAVMTGSSPASPGN